ncbi:adenylyltransferase/cytidyltransferase family protein [Oscillatoria acuminata]|uniref:Cytidyltransferase-related enzyme n=1 Tax=Oscillatoria acuminata PCC 6304 TaxID=56110 RepID=K9TF16_9CYAN|nr:adenylyltransferase/cytidyltransferase family protein [Oscillatoria acuminata]AFY81003.1 cytidyltransferase-related enzyme [Oscillatoria acuminata PCC 6304]
MIPGIYTISNLVEAIAAHPEQWRPLVFTNGCFDLLHVGHVRYLQTAKSLGRTLVVGLNSDRSVQTIKPAQPGLPPRPIIPEIQRAEVLCALKPVDGVIIFNEPTATSLLEALQPDIYVKGGDWTVESLPEAPTVQAYGGRIELCKIEVPTSTTGIILSILKP